MEFSKYFLNSGKSYKFKNMIVKHPTLSDISSLDDDGNTDPENEYWSIVMSLICDPYDYMVQLYDSGIDYETYTNFDMFVFNWNKTREFYLKNKEQFELAKIDPFEKIRFNLSFFLGNHNFELGQRLSGEYVLYDKNDEKYIIDKEMYNNLAIFLKAINKLDFKDRIIPADDNVKLMLIEDMRDEQEIKKRLKKDDTNIEIINNMKIAVCTVIGSVGFYNVDKLHIYQLYSHFAMFNSFTKFNNMLGGIYGGMVSSDAFSQKDWDWVSNI
ncbi:MAG: hypothetical protein ACTTKD_07595 [Peptoanaerobacter stomatis]|uniref:hypothetical protein n=1 Tax=Peptoanaerobacter stomatis TaxID=796937 RepID=UPI003FA13EAF